MVSHKSFPSLLTPSFSPFFQTMSSSTTPSFSAFYAHKRAWRNAVRLAASAPPTKCSWCAGTKVIKTSGQTLDNETGKWVDDAPCEIDCFKCKNGVDQTKQIYEKLVWCQCRNRSNSGFLYAADGRRVFGNDTYLCSHCGFVKQFG